MNPLRVGALATRAMSGDEVARQSLREEGIPCESIADLHAAQRSAFLAMTPVQRAHDFEQTSADIDQTGGES